MPMIETINLTKRYGELIALDSLNLSIEAGDCFGFIGPNGAGKSTTIKITRGFWRGNPAAVTTAQFFRQKEDEYRTFFPGFTIGGPILKERLHFFSGYFPELTRVERSIAYSNGAETTTTRILRHYAINRLDYAPTQKIQINTSYIWTPIRVTGPLKSADPQVARPLTDQSIQGGYTPAQAYTASFNYTITPNLIVSARYGYKYTNDKGNTYGLPTVAQIIYNTNTSLQVTPPVPANLAGARCRALSFYQAPPGSREVANSL